MNDSGSNDFSGFDSGGGDGGGGGGGGDGKFPHNDSFVFTQSFAVTQLRQERADVLLPKRS